MQTKQEQNIISNISENREATMSSVVSNSVAMVILKLIDTYLGNNPSKEAVNQLYHDAIETCRKFLFEDSLIAYIQGQMNETVGWLDKVTVYVLKDNDGYSTNTISLPLNIVFPLVVKACLDDSKFTQHYEGEPEEKFQQAQADQSNRLLSLAHCLAFAKQKGICHQGLRNALVLLLNRVYDGVDIIEDPAAFVTYALKEKILERFYQYRSRLQSLADKKAFGDALYTWITQYDARALCEFMDPEDHIKAEIFQHFISNGSDIANVLVTYDNQKLSLSTFINKTKTTLDFSPDVKNEPLLCMIKRLLNEAPAEKNPSTKDKALTRIQYVIQTEFLLDITQENRIISQFYSIYQSSQRLLDYHSLFLLTNESIRAELEAAAYSFESYYDTIVQTQDKLFPLASAETISQTITVDQRIKEIKKDAMVDDIGSFFSSWFYAIEENIMLAKNLYALLLNPNFQEKIRWSDEAIQAFQANNSLVEEGQTILSITPYQINRILLHAFLVDVKEWSACFETMLLGVVPFIKHVSDDDFVAFSLKKSSYPVSLIQSLEHLQALRHHHNNPETEKPVRAFSKDWFLLPHHVSSVEDWMILSKFLKEADHERLYQHLSWRLKPWLLNKAQDIASIDDFKLFVSVLPNSVREAFFSAIDMHALFEKITRQLTSDRDHSIVSVLFFSVMSVENIKKLIEMYPTTISVYYFCCISQSIFNNIQDEDRYYLDGEIKDEIDSLKDIVTILNDDKQQTFWNELCPTFRKTILSDASKINYFLKGYKSLRKEILFSAYMIQANIDTQEYLDAFQSLNFVGKTILKELIEDLTKDSLISNNLNRLDLKTIYEHFFQAAVEISKNHNEVDVIYYESDDESYQNENNCLPNYYYSISVLALLYAGLLSPDSLTLLKNHWDIFSICVVKCGNLLSNRLHTRLSEWASNNSEDISLILNSVLTHPVPNFILIKRAEQYYKISVEMNDALSMENKVSMFIKHQQLNDFGADLFKFVMHEIKKNKDGLSRKIKKDDYYALLDVITILSEGDGTKELNSVAFSIYILFKKSLLSEKHAMLLKKNWMTIIQSDVPSELYPLLFETIGIENFNKILSNISFSDLLPVFKLCSVQKMEILCSLLRENSFLFQWLYYGYLDFRDKICYSKEWLKEKMDDLGYEKEQIILKYISYKQAPSMVMFFQTHLPKPISYQAKDYLLEAFIIDAQIDVEVQYEPLDHRQKNELKTYICLFIQDNLNVFDTVDTIYLKSIYRNFFERVSRSGHEDIENPALIAVTTSQNFAACPQRLEESVPAELDPANQSRDVVVETATQAENSVLESPVVERLVVYTQSPSLFFPSPERTQAFSPPKPVELTLLEKLYVYLIFISGSIAQVVTMGLMGNEWVDWANEQLTPSAPSCVH